MNRTSKRAAVIFIFITIVLDMLALGIIIPVLPKLIQNFLGGDTAKAAEILGLFATVWAAMQFFPFYLASLMLVVATVVAWWTLDASHA